MILLGLIYIAAFAYGSFLISNRLFTTWTLGQRVWLAGGISLLLMMWTVVPFAFFVGFSLTAHLLAFLFMAGTTAAILKWVKPQVVLLKPKTDKVDLVGLESERKSWWTAGRISFAFGISLLIIFGILFYTHIIPEQDGAIHTGQSTYGDLNLHLGIASSIAVQQKFPPDYSIYPDHKLAYPFFVDSLASTFMIFGFSIRWAFWITSMWFMTVLVSGFLIWAYDLLKNRISLIIAGLLLFLNGGFGFIYFLDNFKENNGQNFTRIFSAFYETPTNLVGNGIHWTNLICDMFIPQRTFMAGWTFLFIVLVLIYRAVVQNDRRLFVIAGIICGLLPMVHTHTYLAIGLMCCAWLFAFWGDAKDKWQYYFNWMSFAIPALLLALPQLLYWTVPQTTEGHFLKWHMDWVNNNDIWIWFWVKNVGIIFLFLVPAFFAIPSKLRKWYSGAIVVFVVSEFVQFQPNEYDNNKLLLVWYAWSVIIVTVFIVGVYQQLVALKFRQITLAIVIFLGIFSGVLTVGREFKSDFELYSAPMYKMSKWVEQKTDKDALFLTGDFHNNPISSLSGRNIYLGTGSFLYFHGFNTQDRSNEVFNLFTNPNQFERSAPQIKIDYVLFSDMERGQFKIDDVYFKQHYPVAFEEQGVRVYAISDRAKLRLSGTGNQALSN